MNLVDEPVRSYLGRVRLAVIDGGLAIRSNASRCTIRSCRWRRPHQGPTAARRAQTTHG